MNYAPEATPPSFMSAPPTMLQSLSSPSPVVMPSPAPSAPTGLLQGHLRPAEIQIVIIGAYVTAAAKPGVFNLVDKRQAKPLCSHEFVTAVVIAGLFNAFFLIVSLRLLWRR